MIQGDLIFKNGLTVKELRELLITWPDKDESGNDSEVWIETNVGLMSPVKFVMRLNPTDIELASAVYQ